MRKKAAALLAILASGVATAQNLLAERDESLVATTRAFVFYSDPVFNLHDFLVWNSRSKQPVEPTECLAGLPAEQRAAFEHARQHYSVFATPAGARLLLALRYRLAGYGDFGLADAAVVEATLGELRAATPAYKVCWWSTHDARNRRWIAALLPLLAAHEAPLSERLRKLYGQPLPQPLPVDVVSYGSFSGADSVVHPDHLLISSVAPANMGYAALEIVFHEASHTVFGPGLDGRLWKELEAAEKASGLLLPPDFWHALLFYTTGSAVKARLAERGIDYEQYLYAQNLFERSWPAFRVPLEHTWQTYVDGLEPMAEAVKQIVQAPMLPDRGDAFVAASHTFTFYSDPVTNLHDFLLWNARSREPVEEAPKCLAALPMEQRAAFEHARDYYASTFANGAGELILLSMHWRLAKLGEIDLADPAQIAATLDELTSAMPAYRACWWREHDARNRRWIASLLPLLAMNEDALRARLAELYGREFARWLPVDVVGYAGTDGGSTVLNPHQFFISSASSANQGYRALEVLFREASYTLFSQRAPGALWQALQQVSSSMGRPIPDELPRVLLFFTTGAAVKARLDGQGARDYVPYVAREGSSEPSLSSYGQLLERVWRPYVDGHVSMAEAARELVEGLPAETR
jgi:hypothetical protein